MFQRVKAKAKKSGTSREGRKRSKRKKTQWALQKEKERKEKGKNARKVTRASNCLGGGVKHWRGKRGQTRRRKMGDQHQNDNWGSRKTEA